MAMAELTVMAEPDMLHQVLAFADDWLNQHGCPKKNRVRIAMAVEELFVNIASYAYAPDSGFATIRMEEDGPSAVRVTFIDEGIPYNPLERPDPDIALPAEEREIGGLGIYMARQIMDDVVYRHEDGKNILTARKAWG